MRIILSLALVSSVCASLAAGDLHGKVTCQGLRDSSDAVVYIESVPGKTFAPPKAHAQVDQTHLSFVPHVLPVLVGTTVDFLNSDTVQHNVFCPDACSGKFNLGTWPKGETRSHTFDKECIATLLCRVHSEMEAFVVAVPTPYFALTNADGSYHIPNVPKGTFTVKVWHSRLKSAQKSVTVVGNTEVDFEIAK